MTTHRYPVSLSWDGSTSDYRAYSRNHRVTSGETGLDLSADPAFRGDSARLNPELLLVAAASSCQLLSYLACAARSGVDIVGYTDAAEGTMPEDQTPVRIAGIVLRPQITVRDEGQRDKALALVEQAHEQCYIANTLACPVEVNATVTVA